MNPENYDEYNDFDELYDSLMDSQYEDWLPDAGIREDLDPETLALLKNF